MTSIDVTDRAGAGTGEVTPEPIMQVASGFMAAKHLFAASELGIFEALADSPASLDALAVRIGLTHRATRISADAMVALGFLEREGDRYRNGPAAARFLAGSPDGGLRPLLRFWDHISYRNWEAFTGALISGPQREIFEIDKDQQQIASAGIEAMQAGPSHALPAVVDLSAYQRLLDVGGGTGSWSIAALEQCPHLRATVLELPVVAELAKARIAQAGLANRISVVAADALTDDLPAGHDVFLVANIAHYWSPTTNIALLQRVRQAAAPGSTLLLVDFLTDATHSRPVQAALLAGEFAAHLKDGDVYSVEEVRSWLPGSGWRFTAHLPLTGPQSVVVAEAG